MEFHDGTYNDSFSSHTRPNDLTDSSEFVSKTRKKDRAETLWDLELEKENEDQLKETEQILNPNSNEDSGRRRRRQASDLNIANIPNNQNILAQISSTGVFLGPLNGAQSTLDFVFVLNVRESELYPPLLLAEDLKCLEEKLSAYQNEFTSGEYSEIHIFHIEYFLKAFFSFHFFVPAEYAKANVGIVENRFLKDCLMLRLPNLAPHTFQFEPQIVVTRISIACTCGVLKTGEKCSTFNSIDEQKWTEFMGNLNSGVYRSN